MLRVLVPLLAAAPLAAADPAPAPRRVPDESALPAALAAALGDHFDYLGGEPVTARGHAGPAAAGRFWYAKVRAKAAGNYVLTYSVRLDPAAAGPRPPAAAEYQFRIAVGARGEPRVFRPDAYAGSPAPLACAGDTLLVPVHVDRGRVDHAFAPVRTVPADDPLFRAVAGSRPGATADPPVVRVEAADRLRLRGSWVTSFGNRPGTATLHALAAEVEFTAPGAFDLAGRLAAGGPAREPVPFRVLPKDRPVTVVAEAFGYTDTPEIARSYAPGGVRPGTLEARVGDRAVVACGQSGTRGRTPPDPGLTGEVEALPFHDVAAYQPR